MLRAITVRSDNGSYSICSERQIIEARTFLHSVQALNDYHYNAITLKVPTSD
jgi:hypothetical protein